MLTILFPFLIGIFEKLGFFFLNKDNTPQEVRLGGVYFLLSLVFISIVLFFFDGFDINIFQNKLFYLCLFMEVFTFVIAKNNYEKQSNYTLISFAQIASIFLIFPITYIGDIIFGFNDPKLVLLTSSSLINNIFFSLYFLIVSLYILFSFKSGKIKHKLLLGILTLSLPITMYCFTRVASLMNPFEVYSMIFFCLGSLYLLASFKNKNSYHKNMFLNFNWFKNTFVFTFFMGLAFSLSFYLALFLSAEFFTIFKRMGQLSAAVGVDWFLKEIKHSKLELFFISGIILTTLIFYYLQ